MNLKELLDNLSAAATPGSWNPAPKRLMIPLQDGRTAEGPMMSYLAGDISSAEGMKVSLGSERLADHRFVAALVNAYRDGELSVRPEEKTITTMPLIKRLKDQRDALADAIRLVVQADDMEAHNEAIFKGKWTKRSKAWGGSFIEQTRKEGMEKARAALEGVPTSEQQLRNIAVGIGMDYEELLAHLSPQNARGGGGSSN